MRETEMSHGCGILADWRERLVSFVCFGFLLVGAQFENGATDSDSVCNQNTNTN